MTRLKQGQIWKKESRFYRITEWSRASIKYKVSQSPGYTESSVTEVTKKEFCRLIKGATLCEDKS